MAEGSTKGMLNEWSVGRGIELANGLVGVSAKKETRLSQLFTLRSLTGHGNNTLMGIRDSVIPHKLFRHFLEAPFTLSWICFRCFWGQTNSSTTSSAVGLDSLTSSTYHQTGRIGQ